MSNIATSNYTGMTEKRQTHFLMTLLKYDLKAHNQIAL